MRPPPGTGPRPYDDPAWAGDESTWSEATKLASLEPRFRAGVQRVLGRLRARGYQPRAWFAWRSIARQEDLARRGHTALRFSLHNALSPWAEPAAEAVDLVDATALWGTEIRPGPQGPVEVAGPLFGRAVAFFRALGEEAHREGWTWGGNYTRLPGTPLSEVGLGWDPGHVQSRPGRDLPWVEYASRAARDSYLAMRGAPVPPRVAVLFPVSRSLRSPGAL